MQLTKQDIKIISNLITVAYNEVGADAENQEISYISQLQLTTYYYDLERLFNLFSDEEKK